MPSAKRDILKRWFQSIISADKRTGVSQLTAKEQSYIQEFIIKIIFFVFCIFLITAIHWKSEWLRFWLQLLTGNWSPDGAEAVGPVLFSISVLIGMVLNWLPLIAAFGFLYKFIKPLETLNQRTIRWA